MASYNKVILIGNLTRDVELRYSPKGTAIGKTGLAVNRKWRDEAGAVKEEVTFVDVDFFGKTAEVVSKYTKKGDPLMVEGRLKLDQWEKDGQKHSRLGVVAENIQLMGSRPAGQGTTQDKPQSERPIQANGATGQGSVSSPAQSGDDDVPF